jgi:uncharacterized membrane protein
MKRVKYILACIGFFLISTQQVFAGTVYTVTDLGHFSAAGLNNQGQVVGSALYQFRPNAFAHRAAIWDPISGFQWIGPDGNDSSQAHDINNNGIAVGQISGYTGGQWGFVWSPNDGLTTTANKVYAINDHGEITPSVEFRDINNSGQMVTSDGYFYDPIDGYQFLGTLGGDNTGANGLNDHGQVAGYSQESGIDAARAIYWDSTNGMTAIGMLDGAFHSRADAINDERAVVGASYHQGAFIWTEETGILSLNDMIPVDSGWWLDEAKDINDLGQIVGNGNIEGDNRAFLLTPIPIPGALWLLGSGLIALVGLRRKLKRN